MSDRETIIRDVAERLRPLGMIALAASFVTDPDDTDMETLIALGPLERLASMSASILDRTQSGLFTSMSVNAGYYNTLLRDAFMTPVANVSVSICVDGEWRRLTTPAELQAALS